MRAIPSLILLQNLLAVGDIIAFEVDAHVLLLAFRRTEALAAAAVIEEFAAIPAFT
jgi:hypothetical protein